MYTCDHCRGLLWDDLYGLLEAGESDGLRQHLTTCSACQSERTRAEADQKLIARVARLDVVVPPFTAPVEETLPFTRLAEILPVGRGRRRGWKPWLAVAAAVLILVGLPGWLLYQDGLLRRELAVRGADDALQQLLVERDRLAAQARTTVENVAAAAYAKMLHVQATGLAGAQTGAPSLYLVQASTLQGHPADVQLTARLVDAKGGVVAESRDVEGRGLFLVRLQPHPGADLTTAVRFDLNARGLGDQVRFQQPISASQPAYATQLSVDKPVHAPGQKIYFRSVTLERFELKPPDRAFTATYELTGPAGFTPQTLTGLTLEGGLGGGEFILPAGSPEGEYALTVTEAGGRFPSLTRRLLVEQTTPTPQAPAAARAAGPLQVEFFPEGGDLVLDLPQRVYFRVRSSNGEPVEIAGRVVDQDGHEIAAVHTHPTDGPALPALARGLGVFTLTPRPGASYRLRITSPADAAATATLPVPASDTSPYPRFALSVPTSVLRQGEDLRVSVASGPGSGQEPLLVGVFCRGRLVALEIAQQRGGNQEVRISPPAGADGVLRVTLLKAAQFGLEAAAERLVYRMPGRRLDLSVAADKESYRPGEHVKLLVRGHNEHQQSERAWLLASVVNDKALGGLGNAGEMSLPAYFHLASQMQRPEDLEGADFLVSDTPQAAAALDLFLGTQGWRRFVYTGRPNPGSTRKAPALEADLAPLLVLDNLPEAEKRFQSELNPAQEEASRALKLRVGELEKEADHRLEVARAALLELDDYKARSFESLRLGMGGVGLVSFGVGCVMLVLALIRMGWGSSLRRRPYLAGAFSSLLLCLVTFMGRSDKVVSLTPSSVAFRLDALALTLKQAPPETDPRVFDRRAMGHALQLASRPTEWTAQPAASLVARSQEAGANPGRSGLTGLQIAEAASFTGSRSPRVLTFSPYGPKREGTDVTPPQVRPLVLREYAHLANGGRPGLAGPSPDTIFWSPILVAPKGSTWVDFTLPPGEATYRVRVEGHSASGRLGMVERKLEGRTGQQVP